MCIHCRSIMYYSCTCPVNLDKCREKECQCSLHDVDCDRSQLKCNHISKGDIKRICYLDYGHKSPEHMDCAGITWTY